MNNPKVLKLVSVSAFIISALFTIILMTSGTVGVLSFILTASMAIILETCKCGFFYESITNKALNLPIRISLATIALLLVFSSIFASAGYIQNQANSTKNMQTKGSTQYKQLEQAKTIQNDLYSSKKSEIEGLKALQNKQQQAGNDIVNSMPKNYIDRRNEQKAATQNQINKTQEIINQKSSELQLLGKDLQSPIDTTNLKFSSDAGYTAMFQSISKWLDNGSTAETLEVWFFISLSIIFELVAVLTAYLSQLKSNYSPRPRIGNDPEKKQKPILNTSTEVEGKRQIESGRLQGMKFRLKKKTSNIMPFKPKEYPRPKSDGVYANSKVDESDIQKYLSFVINNKSKNNNAPGRVKISKGTGIPQEKCRTIHNILIERGYLRTEDKCTKILSVEAVGGAKYA